MGGSGGPGGRGRPVKEGGHRLTANSYPGSERPHLGLSPYQNVAGHPLVFAPGLRVPPKCRGPAQELMEGS